MAYASLTADLVSTAQRGEDGGGQEKARKRRRALVLTHEGARHPYRSTLPPHVFADLIDIPAEKLWDLTRDDVRGFASTYVTVTAAVLAFIF